MFCTKCGAQMDENEKVCPHCGTKVKTEHGMLQEESVPGQNLSLNRGYVNESNWKNIIIIVMAVVVVMLFICILFMNMNRQPNSGEETTQMATTQVTTTEITTTEVTTTEAVTTEAATEAKAKKKKKKKTTGSETMPIGKGTCPTQYDTYYAKVNSGYLALRSAKNNSDGNIIGKMNTGDPVYVVKAQGLYWYVYSPKLGMYGYTNSGYLSTYVSNNSGNYGGSANGEIYLPAVKDGTYLALRNSPYTSNDNIIGKIYSHESVEVYEKNGKFWYVYAPNVGKWGYVNSDYLAQ